MNITTLTRTLISATTMAVIFTLSPVLLNAQTKSNEHEEEKGAHKFTVAIGHAHVQEGMKAGENKWLVMGAWALNYDYLFNSRWSLGSHNDIIIEDFTVEKHMSDEEERELEREVPIATKLVGSFKPGKHASFILGIGDEISKGEHLFLSTVGLEYGWHLSKGWEVGGELSYDVKWRAYDTWILGLGVSKTISIHHKKI